TIPITNDLLVEQSENFQLTLTNPTGGATIGDVPSMEITIVDNDQSLQFAGSGVTVNEAAGTVSLTVTRLGITTGEVSATYTASNGTGAAAQSGSDFPATTGVVTFADGETSKAITIPITDDLLVESAENFLVTLSAPTVTVNEGAGEVTLTVTRVGVSTGTVTAAYLISNGTAQAGNDYQPPAGTLTFNDGETSKTITIPITDDLLIEGNESFTATLSNPTGGATLGAQSSMEVVIADNDQSLQFGAASFNVSEGAGQALLTVTRLGVASGRVTATYTTSGTGSAQPGVDYTETTGVVTFEEGETTKTIAIPITNDLLIEESESFAVTLSGATGGATIGTQATTTVTIVDNDHTLQFSEPEVTVNEAAGQVSLTITRVGTSVGQVQVAYATSSGNGANAASAGVDYTVASGVVTFADGETSKTITIPLTNDLLVENAESFTVTLSSPTGGATLGDVSSTEVTISDNDTSLQLSSATASVNEVAGTVTLTVTRLGVTTGQVSVAFTTSNGAGADSAQAGVDYTATTGVVTFDLNWDQGDAFSPAEQQYCQQGKLIVAGYFTQYEIYTLSQFQLGERIYQFLRSVDLE
ncbi:MAG: hypothetical protein EOP84_15935, partial [Verrucomicrobiaceae bacterium]